MDFSIRKAVKDDLPEVVSLIKELAEYEKALHEVTITLQQLEQDGFGKQPLFWILVAESKDKVVGIAFYYMRYSTWKGKCLYLEDIVVKKEFRGQKVGQHLFQEIIKEAKNIDAQFLNWQVLDWNEPAINFYKKFNAELDGEWINGKLRI